MCYCCTNYMCSSPTLTDKTGSFYFPYDGVKRTIYMTSTVATNLKLDIQNTGYCNLNVELSQNNAGTITPKIYMVEAGKSLTITETNIANIYVTGIMTTTPCYTNCCNRCCNYRYFGNYCNCRPTCKRMYMGVSGNYTIT